jgi:F0F1-type ATP synthase membrane subunit c/vacuolar-type H+-ATPase subunit K
MVAENIKFIVIIGLFIALCGGAIGTGCLFSGFLIASSRNPEELETLFNYTLIGFALIETFIFFAFIVSGFFLFIVCAYFFTENFNFNYYCYFNSWCFT